MQKEGKEERREKGGNEEMKGGGVGEGRIKGGKRKINSGFKKEFPLGRLCLNRLAILLQNRLTDRQNRELWASGSEKLDFLHYE